LGIDFPRDEAIRILQALEFNVKPIGNDALQATAPPHRLDLQEGAADLIEDLVRIHGYDRLPATLLADRLPKQETNVPLGFEERLRDLRVGCGVQEVITYALTMPEKETPLYSPSRGMSGATSPGPREYVNLKNPISSERVVLRQTLLAGVLETAANNLRNSE